MTVGFFSHIIPTNLPFLTVAHLPLFPHSHLSLFSIMGVACVMECYTEFVFARYDMRCFQVSLNCRYYFHLNLLLPSVLYVRDESWSRQEYQDRSRSDSKFWIISLMTVWEKPVFLLLNRTSLRTRSATVYKERGKYLLCFTYCKCKNGYIERC